MRETRKGRRGGKRERKKREGESEVERHREQKRRERRFVLVSQDNQQPLLNHSLRDITLCGICFVAFISF